MTGLEVLELASIDSVNREELEELADDPRYTWGWLKAFEDLDSIDISPRHIAIRDGDGLVGFAPCFLQKSAIFDDVREELLLQWQIRILDLLGEMGFSGLRLTPCLVSGAPEGFSSKILVAQRLLEDRQKIFDIVLQGLGDQSRKDGSVCFGFTAVAESDPDLSRTLDRAGFSYSLRTANAILDIEWGSFAEYLASLKISPRRSLKHEERSYQRCGLETRLIDDFKYLAEDLSRLAGNVHARHSPKPNPFTQSLYENLASNMFGRAKVFVAEKNGKICGFILVLEHKGKMIAHHYGTDYSAEVRAGHMYFNLAYHAPIRYAIQRGIRTISYGPGEWRAKSRKGCRFEGIRIYLRSPKRLNALLLRLLLRYVDHRKEEWIRDRLSSTRQGT